MTALAPGKRLPPEALAIKAYSKKQLYRMAMRGFVTVLFGF